MRVPRYQQELGIRIERTRDELATSLGHQPTIAELSHRLGIDQEHVLEALELALARRTVALEPLRAHAEADDLMPGDLDEGYRRVEDRAVLVWLLANLSARDAQIVFLRFTADLTQDVIARRLGVSQMSVSRALRRSLSTLRDAAA